MQTTETKTRYPLARADKYAARIAAALHPYCERIEIAGSIRRQRPDVGDIDLVIIPRYDIDQDMFGSELMRTNCVWDFLHRTISDNAGTARLEWLTGEGNPNGQNYLLRDREFADGQGMDIDLFCATEETWGTLMLCRTGSKHHNAWFAQQARNHGAHWHPYKGLQIPKHPSGHNTIAKTEQNLYAALQLDYREPQDRENP